MAEVNKVTDEVCDTIGCYQRARVEVKSADQYPVEGNCESQYQRIFLCRDCLQKLSTKILDALN